MKKNLPVLYLILGFLGMWLLLRYTPYPELDALLNQPYSCRVYDCNGNIIQITSLDDGLKREFLPLEEISPQVRTVFIKAEDKRFYFHHGVDYTAAITAFFQNLSSKKTIRGASTIPMQLAKICSPVEVHSFSRKLQDVLNAYRIEARFSKKKILELYLNSLPFGMNVCGVNSAARTFFGKPVNDLSPEQLCCLAVIPRRPSSYNPINHPTECAEMAREIADGLSFVNAQAVETAAKTAQAFEYPYKMPHYILYLKKTAPQLFENYELHLSVDMDVQIQAETLLSEALLQAKNSRISNGALLLINNKDASVISWVGSENWFDDSVSGQIDGVLVKNQPGSSMKPFLYALAFDTPDEKGNPLYYPSKVIADIPQEFGGENLYIPANFNNRFNGPIRTRVALASSLNIPAVTILNEIGVNNYLNKLYELGFDSLRYGGKEADLGLALGAGEVTLYELVNAFSIFPRDGKDFKGNQIYSQDTARLICSILSDKSSRALGFGYAQTFETDYPSIFKTGTSNQYQNITALGATKDFTIGVWMGNFAGQTVIGKTGSSLPAWVAKNLLDYVEKSVDKNIQEYDKSQVYEKKDFDKPENWTLQKICSLSGLKAGPNCPASVYEYIKNGCELESCDWHKKNTDGDIEIIFPSEFQQWIKTNNINAVINYNSSPLTLLSPRDNSIFYYSSTSATKQAINVQVIGGSANQLSIFYDNNPSFQVQRPFDFHLPVERGNHTCTCICGNEKITFNFLVK